MTTPSMKENAKLQWLLVGLCVVVAAFSISGNWWFNLGLLAALGSFMAAVFAMMRYLRVRHQEKMFLANEDDAALEQFIYRMEFPEENNDVWPQAS